MVQSTISPFPHRLLGVTRGMKHSLRIIALAAVVDISTMDLHLIEKASKKNVA